MTAKVSVTASWCGTSVAGFVVAFVSDWRVSLLCCSLLPFLYAVYFVFSKVNIFSFIIFH